MLLTWSGCASPGSDPGVTSDLDCVTLSGIHRVPLDASGMGVTAYLMLFYTISITLESFDKVQR